MKKQFLIFGMLMTSILLLDSCSKQEDAGILIDGNGRPRSAAAATPVVPATVTNGNIVGKDTAMSDYGIAIDPDGRP